MSLPGIPKTSLQLYRDCLRLVRYVAPGNSSKSHAIRKIVKQEFVKNRAIEEEQQIKALQLNAIRALSNYLLFQNANSDPKVKQAVTNFHERNVTSAQAATIEQQQQQQQQQQRGGRGGGDDSNNKNSNK